MSETICPDCGERNGGAVEFCSACGAFLAWDGPGDSSAAAPAPGGPPAAARSAPSGQTRSGPVPGLPTGRAAAPPAGPAPGGYAAGPPSRSYSGPPPAWPNTGVQQLRPPAGPPTGSYRQPPPSTNQPYQQPPPGNHQQYQQPPAQPRFQPPPPVPEQQPPVDNACPRCAVVNDPSLRFCRKCGLALSGPTLHDAGLGRPEPAPERIAWWRRWFRPAPNTRRAARAAYRHSLPIRYRLMRYVFALLGIGAIVGGLTLIGQNPVGWVTARINDLQGSLVQVQGLQAYSEPAAGTSGTIAPTGTAATTAPAAPTTSLPATDTAPNLLDNLSDTAWATAWSADLQQDPAAAPCVSPATPSAAGAPGSVLIVPEGSVTVREISVAGGLSKDDARRLLQWRPRTIQLAFSDGRCQQIVLTDTDGLQQHSFDPVQTSQIRISVIDAYPPATDQPTNEVAISEVRLFQRP